MSKLSNPDHDVAIEFAAKYLDCLSVTVAAKELGIEFGVRGDAYYVYFLLCPETSRLIYVGKGKGNRLNAHYKEFCRGVVSGFKKYVAIAALAKRGLKPRAVVFADGMDEYEAYRLERRLICQIGRRNLSNSAPGGCDELTRIVRDCDDALNRLRPFDAWDKHYRHPGSSRGAYALFLNMLLTARETAIRQMECPVNEQKA